MNWFIQVLKKYAVFEGRAQRAEYWYFALFVTIIIFVLVFIDRAIGSYDRDIGLGVLSGIFILAILIPSFAVSVRRLHDTNRSGWWVLLGFIPFGSIVLIVFYVFDSYPEENQYGMNPKITTT